MHAARHILMTVWGQCYSPGDDAAVLGMLLQSQGCCCSLGDGVVTVQHQKHLTPVSRREVEPEATGCGGNEEQEDRG